MMFFEMVELLESTPWLWGSVLLVFGCLVGSFLNVVILRLPERMEWEFRRDALEELGGGIPDGLGDRPPGIVYERSHCPKCGHVLSWWENLPVLSWLMLRGRCRSCGVEISMQYPVVEWLVGMLFLSCGVMMVGTGESALGMKTVGGLVLLGCLVGLSGMDWRVKWIPDGLTLSLLWLGLLFNAWWGDVALDSAVLGAVFGYVLLWLVSRVFLWVRGIEGVGLGDVKLLAALGAWVGVWGVLPILLIASAGGLVFALVWRCVYRGDTEIPFGPALAFGGWWVYVAGVPDVLLMSG